MTTQTQSNCIYLALGTNLGDRMANLQAAIAQLPPAVTVLRPSPVYQTPPWGYESQPDFLNQVILAETRLSPGDLLTYLKQIETNLGRMPTFRYGPRVVDLDILFYADQVVDSPQLQIPHPRLPARAFVLVPLNDLNPDLRHPALNCTIQTLLAKVDAAGVHPFHPDKS